MFFVVDKPRLQRLIALTRDDRRKDQQRDGKGPFYRIEATGDRLKLTGHKVEAAFPTTVYEPGVLFLRVSLFRRLLETFREDKAIAIQVNEDGLSLGNVQISFAVGDMLLYVDPSKAPQRHPDELAGESTGIAYLSDGDPWKGASFEGMRRRSGKPKEQ